MTTVAAAKHDFYGLFPHQLLVPHMTREVIDIWLLLFKGMNIITHLHNHRNTKFHRNTVLPDQNAKSLTLIKFSLFLYSSNVSCTIHCRLIIYLTPSLINYCLPFFVPGQILRSHFAPALLHDHHPWAQRETDRGRVGPGAALRPSPAHSPYQRPHAPSLSPLRLPLRSDPA